MPEMRFHVQWPDGSREACYSPSLIIKEYFVPGMSYDLAEFVGKCREALDIASRRVHEKYGYFCSSAMDQMHAIDTRAERFRGLPDPKVLVESFTE